jgi:hypothetical protein
MADLGRYRLTVAERHRTAYRVLFGATPNIGRSPLFDSGSETWLYIFYLSFESTRLSFELTSLKLTSPRSSAIVMIHDGKDLAWTSLMFILQAFLSLSGKVEKRVQEGERQNMNLPHLQVDRHRFTTPVALQQAFLARPMI